MGEVDDGWMERALKDPLVVADVLLSLHHSDCTPETSPEAEEEDVDAPACWGSRQRRSRIITIRQPKSEAAAAEADGWTSSPLTPLDFVNGGSGSSSNGGCQGKLSPAAKRSRSDKPAAAHGGGNCQTQMVVRAEPRNPSPKPIRRPTKRKAIVELEAMQKSLLQQREMLHKEIESCKRVYESLVLENEQLKKPKLSREPQSRADVIPDLNIPLFCEEFSG